MEKDKHKTIECLKNLVQIVILIFAFGFGLLEFVYKEYIRPEESAHISISLKFTTKKSNYSLTPVKLKICIKNTCKKKLYFLTNYFEVYAYKMLPSKLNLINHFEKKPILDNSGDYVNKYAKTIKSERVSFGGCFRDTFINPNEEINSDVIIYIPSNKYNMLYGMVYIDTSFDKKNTIISKTNLNKDDTHNSIFIDSNSKKQLDTDKIDFMRYESTIGLMLR